MKLTAALQSLLPVALLAGTSCAHRLGFTVAPRPGPAPATLSPAPSPHALSRFESTRPQMGLPFRIVVHATNEIHANTAINAAFARIEELNGKLSDYDTDSELSQLSRTSGLGTNVVLSPDLWDVLARSQELAQASAGGFDVTVGPIVNLWRKARREHQLPRPDLLRAARERVGWPKLHLDARRRTARLDVEGMRLDLGAIAKGYAVDAALSVLAAHGIQSALVSGGGDLAVSAAPPGRKGWQIELAPLDASNAPPARFVALHHAALATSGDLFQHVEIDGRRYSHIVDPRTGVGLTDHSLVTVIAPDCTTADSLATAVSVLGPARGLRLIQNRRGVEARIIRAPEGRIEARVSPGFGRFLVAP